MKSEKESMSRKKKKDGWEGRATLAVPDSGAVPTGSRGRETPGLLSDDGLGFTDPGRRGPCAAAGIKSEPVTHPTRGPRGPETHHKMLRHVSNTCQLCPSGT